MSAGLEKRGTLILLQEPTIPRVLADRYSLEKVIGRGGMCEVYLARDRKLSKLWAVKRQMPVGESSAKESLKDEATLLSSVSHPALPLVADFFEEEGLEHLVMEYCEGVTLAKILEDKPLPLIEALDVVYQLADVLAYLHSQPQPIIYRDLKPHNIIVAPSGKVKLIDFGIARARRSGSYSDTQGLGTPGYAAPEQYGNGSSDQRTDIFGLGATFHHSLTGLHPGRNPFTFPPITQSCPQLPLTLELLVDKAVSLKPEERFQSVSEFQEALKRVCRHRDMQALLNPEAPDTLETPSRDLQVDLREKELQIEDLHSRVKELGETIRSLQQELALERDRSRSLLAQRSVEDKSVFLELERVRATLELKKAEVAEEKAERVLLERVLSQARAETRSLQVQLLRYEEAFRKAGAEAHKAVAERDAEIVTLRERGRKLETMVHSAQARIQELRAYLLDLSLVDGEGANPHYQKLLELGENPLPVADLPASAADPLERQERENEHGLSATPTNPPEEQNLLELSLKSTVSQLEQALEEACRLWLTAAAALAEREV